MEFKELKAIHFELGMPIVSKLQKNLGKIEDNDVDLSCISKLVAIYLASPSILRKYKSGNIEVLEPLIEQAEDMSLPESGEIINFFINSSVEFPVIMMTGTHTPKGLDEITENPQKNLA